MKLLQKLVSAGADISTRKTLKSALRVLGIKPDNIDRLYVDLKNSLNEDVFRETTPEEKMVFIPQCLRNSRKCKAKLTGLGYKCVGCSKCKARRIKEKGENLGYRVFIVPGGSAVFNIIKMFKPKAVFGVSCLKELIMAFEELGVPTRSVELTRDGCVDTDVNIQDVFKILEELPTSKPL